MAIVRESGHVQALISGCAATIDDAIQIDREMIDISISQAWTKPSFSGRWTGCPW